VRTVALAAAALICFTAAAYKLPRRRGPVDSALARAGTLAALGLGLTLKLPGVYRSFDALLGMHNVAQLPKDAFVLLSASGTQVILLQLVHGAREAGPRARRRSAVAAGAVVVMTIAFLLARTGPEDPEFARRHIDQAGLVEFRLIYLGYLAFAFLDIVRLCVRFARLAGERLLGTGLRLIAVGGGVGLGYVAASLVSLLAVFGHDSHLDDRADSLAESLILVATLLVVVGSTLPSWGPRVGLRSGSPTGLQRQRLDRLEPLWRGLTAAVPDVVLEEAGNARGGAGVHERLYRRVIEIEDARLALRPLLDPSVVTAAARIAAERGLDGATADAAVEGASLALAIRSDRAVTPSARSAASPSRRREGVLELNAEAAWLGDVASSFVDEGFLAEVRRSAWQRIDLTYGNDTHVHTH